MQEPTSKTGAVALISDGATLMIGGFIGVLPGSVAFDSAFSFGLIRGGPLDT